EIAAVLAIRHVEVKEAISVIITPGRATASVYDQVCHSSAGRDIGKSSIAIVTVKVIRALTAWVTAGVHHIEVEVTIVIIIAPHRGAIVTKGSEAGRRCDLRKSSVPVVLIQRLIHWKVILSAGNIEIEIAIVIVVPPCGRAAIGELLKASGSRDIAESAVVVIVVETIGQFGPPLSNGAKEVRPPVIIVINEDVVLILDRTYS